MPKITPFLWFDDRIEEAVNFYVSVFGHASIKSSMPGPGGGAMSMTFELEGQHFMALNGGPRFRFTEAISFFVFTGHKFDAVCRADRWTQSAGDALCLSSFGGQHAMRTAPPWG